jgi:hypothetical protein
MIIISFIWDNYHYRKQTRVNHTIYFSTNPILNEKIKINKLKTIKKQKTKKTISGQ